LKTRTKVSIISSKRMATRRVLHVSDVRENPFSPKLGRRVRDCHAFNMLSEKSGKLVCVWSNWLIII